MGRTLKLLINGESGTGKTRLALTFPKITYLGTEPNGLDVVESEPELKKNIVMKEEFIPSPLEGIKSVFERLDKAIIQAHTAAREGKVETLTLDNLTFLAQNRWIYINECEPIKARDGSLDTRGMYGALGAWLYKFTLMNICSFPGNVVVTCHEQKDDDEDMKKVVDPTVPITPNILGGFRNKVAGMFSASLYLEVKRGMVNGKVQYVYQARCLKGNQRNAKNRYGLPEIVQDVSYNMIMKHLVNQQGGVDGHSR